LVKGRGPEWRSAIKTEKNEVGEHNTDLSDDKKQRKENRKRSVSRMQRGDP